MEGINIPENVFFSFLGWHTFSSTVRAHKLCAYKFIGHPAETACVQKQLKKSFQKYFERASKQHVAAIQCQQCKQLAEMTKPAKRAAPPTSQPNKPNEPNEPMLNWRHTRKQESVRIERWRKQRACCERKTWIWLK